MVSMVVVVVAITVVLFLQTLGVGEGAEAGAGTVQEVSQPARISTVERDDTKTNTITTFAINICFCMLVLCGRLPQARCRQVLVVGT